MEKYELIAEEIMKKFKEDAVPVTEEVLKKVGSFIDSLAKSDKENTVHVTEKECDDFNGCQCVDYLDDCDACNEYSLDFLDSCDDCESCNGCDGLEDSTLTHVKPVAHAGAVKAAGLMKHEAKFATPDGEVFYRINNGELESILVGDCIECGFEPTELTSDFFGLEFDIYDELPWVSYCEGTDLSIPQIAIHITPEGKEEIIDIIDITEEGFLFAFDIYGDFFETSVDALKEADEEDMFAFLLESYMNFRTSTLEELVTT